MELNLNKMAKFIFIIEEELNREASKIEFEVPNDMDVWEYKRMCIRMAGAMGYTSLSVKKAFGQEYNEKNWQEEISTSPLMYAQTGSYL